MPDEEFSYCPRCTKSFTGPNRKLVVDPKRHCWVNPDGKTVYCDDATLPQLGAYKKVRAQVDAQRAEAKLAEARAKRAEK